MPSNDFRANQRLDLIAFCAASQDDHEWEINDKGSVQRPESFDRTDCGYSKRPLVIHGCGGGLVKQLFRSLSLEMLGQCEKKVDIKRKNGQEGSWQLCERAYGTDR